MAEMTHAKQPGMEPLPGYRLIEPLGSGGYGEVWKCEVTGGIYKAIKFVRGNLNSLDPEAAAQQELAAFERIKAIRHPFVLSLERVEIIDGELIIAMELADENLEDRLQQCQSRGEHGIERRQLLFLLGEAAEVLDLFNFEYNLQHLDIKPANLFVVRNHIKVADFGLVQNVEDNASAAEKNSTHGISPQYSAPELFGGEISRFSDQYSLAIVYQVLLTGTFPFNGQHVRKLMLQHLLEEPDLLRLPKADRGPVAKALAKNPKERFASCQEFIQALQSADTEAYSTSSDHGEQIVLEEDSFSKHDTLSVVSISETKKEKLFESDFFQMGKGAESSETDTDADIDIISGFRILESLRNPLPGKLLKLKSDDGKVFLGCVLGSEKSVAHRVETYHQKLNQIRHGAVPPQQFVQVDGLSLLLTEYRQPTLLEQALPDGAKGEPRLPVADLLAKLECAAVALDELYEAYEVPHLCLHPNSIMAAEDRIWFSDFGFGPFFWVPGVESLEALNYRYSAPEFAENRLHRNTDQYSLALIYVEMLTGVHPRPQSAKQLRRRPNLDLTFVPSSDLPVLAKALDPVPENRFSSCSEFVHALKKVRKLELRSQTEDPRSAVPIVSISNLIANNISSEMSKEDARKDWEAAIGRICGVWQFHRDGRCQYVEKQDNSLFCNASLRLHKGVVQPKLQAFCEQWGGVLSKLNEDTHCVRLLQKKGVFSQILKGQSGVEVVVHLLPEDKEKNVYSGVEIDVRHVGRPNAETVAILKTTGPKLLETLAAQLQLPPDQQTCLKAPPGSFVVVRRVHRDLSIEEPVRAIAVEVSLGGIMLEYPEKPSFRKCYIHFETDPDPNANAYFAKFNWAEQGRAGRFVVGASLF